jgi:hypothetical protein
LQYGQSKAAEKIEYLLIELDPDKPIEELQKDFDTLGADGWIYVAEVRRANMTKIVGVFHRKSTGNVQPLPG